MKKRSKYNNVKTEVYGIMFDSKKEANRYMQLVSMELDDEITCLELQKPYPIEINGIHCFKYLCDFYYLDRATNKWVTEDVKGMKTAIYRLKKKMVEAYYGIKILET